MGRKLLWASLVLAPITLLLRYAFDVGDTALFVAAAAALVPLAWLIGEATEHAGEHTGPGIGGFLNASFGNAPELIIALFAVNEALPDVVRGSLAGSVVSNILLVLGAALIFGGKAKTGSRSTGSRSSCSSGSCSVAVLLFLVPSVPRLDRGYGAPLVGGALDSRLDRALARVRGDDGSRAAPPQAAARGERRDARRGLVAARLARSAGGGDGGNGVDQRDPRPLAPLIRGVGRALGVLHRDGDRGDRRERGRARRRDRDRQPREAAAGVGDRGLLERPGGAAS